MCERAYKDEETGDGNVCDNFMLFIFVWLSMGKKKLSQLFSLDWNNDDHRTTGKLITFISGFFFWSCWQFIDYCS